MAWKALLGVALQDADDFLASPRLEDFAEPDEIVAIELSGDRGGAVVSLAAVAGDGLGDGRQQVGVEEEEPNIADRSDRRQQEKLLRETARVAGEPSRRRRSDASKRLAAISGDSW